VTAVRSRLGPDYPEGPIERANWSGLAEHHVISTALFETYGTPGYAPARRSVVAAERAEIRR
jgi:3-hydroxybutyryl-CoA dehydrogenase